MASLLSLPPELVAHIVRVAAWPTAGMGWWTRADELRMLSLVRILHKAAQRELFRAVPVLSRARAEAFVEVVKSRDAGPLVEMLYVDDLSDDDDASSLLAMLANACPDLRVVHLANFRAVRLDPLAGLTSLTDLYVKNCGITLSPHAVFPRLKTLTLVYTVASRGSLCTLFTPTCLPRLRHLVLDSDNDSDFPDTEADPEVVVFARPPADFVAGLVSIEHRDVRLCRQYGTTRAGGYNSLAVVDVRFVPMLLDEVRRSGGQLHHLRVDFAAARIAARHSEVTGSIAAALKLLMAGVAGEGEHAQCLRTLRTLFLPDELDVHPDLSDHLIQSFSGGSVKVNVVFFDDSFEREEPLGELSTFMRMAEAQQAVAH
ncbi:hypothetical protein JCM10450v2_002376 [Rhodotorula kratochvilovae]